jgi:hypothetical protein
MFRKVGKWSVPQAGSASYSDRHCDAIQWRSVSPCFAFHLIQPEQEWESEKGKRVEQKIESFRLRCSSVLIGSIRHRSDCAAGLQWKMMMTTRVSFFERRKAADRSSTKCTQNIAACLPSVPAFWFEVGWSWLWFPTCKPRALVETSQNWASSLESNAGFWITKHRCIHSRSLSYCTLISLCY